MKYDLVLNQSEISKSNDTFSEFAERMRSVKKILEDNHAILSADWKTPAGRAFATEYGEKAANSEIEDHIKVMDHIAENFIKINNGFQSVFDAAERVKTAANNISSF